jgi:hypothetical protein
MVIVFNATFNNISVILQRSVLLEEENNGLPQVTGEIYYVTLHKVHLAMSGIQTHNLSGVRR